LYRILAHFVSLVKKSVEPDEKLREERETSHDAAAVSWLGPGGGGAAAHPPA
jgi:hypothetical protein